MAAVDMTADVPVSPQDAWDHAADLAELGEWLVLHEAWRGGVPDELAEGTKIEGVWLTVRPEGDGSVLGLRLELGGRCSARWVRPRRAR